MPTFPTMPLIMPTVGGSSGSWGTLLASAFLVLDGHQHLGVGSGGAQIVSAAININADLTFASYSATNLRSATFAAGQAVSGVRKLYVGANSELYWNNSAAGTAIQLTNGTALNVSAFIGGIGGDYTSVSAALNYDNSAARYTLKAGGGTTWARVAAGEVRIHEHASTSSIYVALAAPAGIASPYTVTFPAAVPAAKRLVQASAAGVLTFENTGIEAATFSGLITASAGLTCAANQHVTISGTGEVKHGNRERTFSPAGYTANNATLMVFSSGPIKVTTGAAAVYYMAIPFDVGDRIKSVSFAYFGDGAADLQADMLHTTAAGVESSIGTVGVTNAAAAWASTTVDLTDTTLATGESLTFSVQVTATGLFLGSVRVTYDRP
jgi:hypothetical protein